MEKVMKRNINWKLPWHIIEVIFSKLAIVNLPICRLVCKSWNDVILNQASIPETCFFCIYDIPKIHYMEFKSKLGMSFVASITFDDGDWLYITINNSCNGLLLIFKFGYVSCCVGILNPINNEYIKLPRNHPDEDDETYGWRANDFYRYGFGFSLKTRRYKVVKAYLDEEESTTFFDILTFGGRSCNQNQNQNQWRYVDSVPFMISKDAVYLNGALYWIGIDKKNVNNITGFKYVICRFDVENEKVETTVTLSEIGPSKQVTITNFNGSVYATFCFMDPYYKIEVWGMQNQDSWTREFVINGLPIPPISPNRVLYFQLIKPCENGHILCLVNETSFILYNPNTGSIHTVNQYQDMEFLWLCQVNSVNFASLQNILAGDI